jgi:hypothetical protein
MLAIRRKFKPVDNSTYIAHIIFPWSMHFLCKFLFKRFRGQMKDIEMILENLMISVFEQVENLEEGVHALQAFYYYSKRDALHPLYDQKTVAVSCFRQYFSVCLLSGACSALE